MAKKSDTVTKFLWTIEGEGRLMRHLKRKWSAVGKLAYLEIIEAIAKAEGHALDLSNPLDLEDLADEACTTAETMLEIIEYCVTYGRFDAELWQGKMIIWCNKFIEGVSDYYTRDRKRPVPQRPEYQHPRDYAEFPRDSAYDPSVKYSIVENSTVQNSIETFDFFSENQKSEKQEISLRKPHKNQPVPRDLSAVPGWADFLQAYGGLSCINSKKDFQAWQAANEIVGPEVLNEAAINYRLFVAKSGQTKFNPRNWLNPDDPQWVIDWVQKAKEVTPKTGANKAGYTTEHYEVAAKMAAQLKDIDKNFDFENDE